MARHILNANVVRDVQHIVLANVQLFEAFDLREEVNEAHVVFLASIHTVLVQGFDHRAYIDWHALKSLLERGLKHLVHVLKLLELALK